MQQAIPFYKSMPRTQAALSAVSYDEHDSHRVHDQLPETSVGVSTPYKSCVLSEPASQS